MKNCKLLILFISLFLGSHCGKVFAFPSPEPAPLPYTINNSEVIVLAKVTGYVPDTELNTSSTTLVGSGQVVALTALKLPGAYTFTVIQSIKGGVIGGIQVHLPYVSSVFYDGAKLSINEGTFVLLFLRHDGNVLVAVDQYLPLIDLGDNFANVKLTTPDVVENVVELMLSSLHDQNIILANTHLLRSVVSSQIPIALSPLVEQVHDDTLDNVLYCLGENQVVWAIPRIARLQAQFANQGSGAYSINTLEGFTTQKAVPYLNVLLTFSDIFTRSEAISGLRKTADASSIPYLLLALRDPDPQRIIPYEAYATLNRLIPTLGTIQTMDYFRSNQQALTKPAFAWWSEYLSGKRNWQVEHDQNQNDNVTGALQGLENLKVPRQVFFSYPSLFSPVALDRVKAIHQIQAQADRSSIPFLMIALQDPDNEVGYTAYNILYGLVPELGQPQSHANFEANKERATKPVYDWWNTHMKAGHVVQLHELHF